jgi:hypothetical protein
MLDLDDPAVPQGVGYGKALSKKLHQPTTNWKPLLKRTQVICAWQPLRVATVAQLWSENTATTISPLDRPKCQTNFTDESEPLDARVHCG